jgi:hypothetical protein
MSQYPIPPPSYGSTSPSPKSPNAPLYSSNRYQGEPGSSAGIYNQPAPDDLPDDFKVRLDRTLRPGAFFDILHSTVSPSWIVLLRYGLRSFGKCTPSFVRPKHDLRCPVSAWLILLSFATVAQIVGIL